MNPLLLALIVVANAAIFIYFDAARIRDSHHVGVGPRGIAPHAWASLVFLVLPLALPYYLYIRGTVKSTASREGPPPQFTARDLNVWGYVSSVAFLALAVYLGLIGRFSWAGVAGLAMVAGLFGGRKPVQVGEGERDFELGGAAWDMSGFRPVDEDVDDLDDDQRDVVPSGGGSFIPPVAGPGGRVLPGRGPQASGAAGGEAGVDIFAPPRPTAQQPAQSPEQPPGTPPIAPRTVVADAAPLLAMSASEDDEDVWDPLRADEEAQRAREAPVSEPFPAIERPPAPPVQPPAAPQPAAPASAQPLYPTPSPAQTQPLSALSTPPSMPPPSMPPSTTPPAQSPPAQSPPAQAPPAQSPPAQATESPLAMTLGEELPPGLVDDEEPSLLDDELAPFELASDEDDEEILLVEPVDEGDDEDLEMLAPLPPVATSSRRPTPRSSPPTSNPPAPAPPTGEADGPTRPSRRPAAPPVDGYAGQAKASGATALFVWFAVIAAILGVAWWIGTRDDGVADDLVASGSAVETQADDEADMADVADDAQTAAASRAAAAEEAMRRKMNGWISTYDTVMKPVADLVEQIDFGELQQGACLDLQRQAEKADRQLKASPDEEVEILLRPAFEAFLAASRSCSGGNEVEWSVHLLQAKDHTHETQILLDERYRYVGPFELEQEEALGHQRSLETISGRYLAGQLESQRDDTTE